MESHAIISHKLGFVDNDIFEELHKQMYDILRILSALIKYKKNKHQY